MKLQLLTAQLNRLISGRRRYLFCTAWHVIVMGQYIDILIYRVIRCNIDIWMSYRQFQYRKCRRVQKMYIEYIEISFN